MIKLPPCNKKRICINALLSGQTIDFGEYKLRLFNPGETIQTPSFEGESESYWLGYEMGSDGKKVYIGADIPFADMLTMFDRISEEKAIEYASNTVLTEISRKEK